MCYQNVTWFRPCGHIRPFDTKTKIHKCPHIGTPRCPGVEQIWETKFSAHCDETECYTDYHYRHTLKNSIAAKEGPGKEGGSVEQNFEIMDKVGTIAKRRRGKSEKTGKKGLWEKALLQWQRSSDEQMDMEQFANELDHSHSESEFSDSESDATVVGWNPRSARAERKARRESLRGLEKGSK